MSQNKSEDNAGEHDHQNHEQAIREEESRITEAYARRRTALPQGRGNRLGLANLLTLHERERQTISLLEANGCIPLATKRILEVGCGSGYWLRDFVRWGAQPKNLFGIDLLPQRIADAARLCPPDVTLQCGSAANLPYPDASFDLVVQSTVFTSVLDAGLKQRIADEMLRVLKPEGLILWYDFRMNNPRNPDVQGVGRREIHRLFPGCRIQLRSITLAPPICRKLAPVSRLACEVLCWIPLLRTHYLGLIRKTGSSKAGPTNG